MILRLASGSATPSSAAKYSSAASTRITLHAHVLGQGVHDLVAFLAAQQAGVDEDAGELVADGLVQQRRHHRGIDAAGQAQQHVVVADLFADPRHLVGDDRSAPSTARAQPQMSCTKRFSIAPPCFVCVTSGWNCTP